jgi:hypothetical protein
MKTPNLTFITEVTSEHTGGGCMVDVITLTDGRCISICEEGLAVFDSFTAFDEREGVFPVLNFHPHISKFPRKAD